jgi:anoctamin-10
VNPDADMQQLSNSERIRLIHSLITSTPKDGGLGISPEAPEWDLIESIFPLHDRKFNEHWIRAWKPRNKVSFQLDTTRDQFGDSIALYFAFLSSYTSFLVVPAILGLSAHFFLPPYSPVYSISLSIWSIAFVEWWRIHERILSLRFGTRGSFRVEKDRIQYTPGMSWWLGELRVLASIPVIILFAGVLSAILTVAFVFEAFVTELYQGPGKQIIVSNRLLKVLSHNSSLYFRPFRPLYFLSF